MDYYINCTLEYPTNKSYTDLICVKGRAQSLFYHSYNI